MNKILCLKKVFTNLQSLNVLRANSISIKYFSTSKDLEGETKDEAESKIVEKEAEAKENADLSEFNAKLSGFAQSYKRFSHIDDKTPDTPQTFASLIRNSKFVDLGNPEGKLVTGEIFNIVGDDLYVDFGWKFYCVCQRPIKNGQYYVRGSKVRLKIKDLELSSRFLGATTDITLLEADCILMGLISSPLRISEQKAGTRTQNV